MSAELQPRPDMPDDTGTYDRNHHHSYRDFTEIIREPETPQESAFLHAFEQHCRYEATPALNIDVHDPRRAKLFAFEAHHFISSIIATNAKRLKERGVLLENASPLSRPAVDNYIAAYFSNFKDPRSDIPAERSFIEEHTRELYRREEREDGSPRKVSKLPGHPEIMLGLQLSELLHGTGREVAAHGVDVYLAAIGQRLEETLQLGRLSLHSYDRGTRT